MASNRCVYEGMFILDSNRYARDPAALSGQLSEMIEKLGGEVLASRLWNEQRLAYPIQGHRKGTYWLTYFRMDANQLSGFARACQLNENILRHLTLKVDPRLVDMLVAHARGEKVDAEPEAKGPAEPVPVPVPDDASVTAKSTAAETVAEAAPTGDTAPAADGSEQ